MTTIWWSTPHSGGVALPDTGWAPRIGAASHPTLHGTRAGCGELVTGGAQGALHNMHPTRVGWNGVCMLLTRSLQDTGRNPHQSHSPSRVPRLPARVAASGCDHQLVVNPHSGRQVLRVVVLRLVDSIWSTCWYWGTGGAAAAHHCIPYTVCGIRYSWYSCSPWIPYSQGSRVS